MYGPNFCLHGKPGPSFSSLAKSPEAKGHVGFGTTASVFGSLDGKPGPSFSSLAKSPEAKGEVGFGTTTNVSKSGKEFNFGRSINFEDSVVDKISSSSASSSNKISCDIITNTTQTSASKNAPDDELEKITIEAISLSAPGEREVVDTKRAEEIVKYWEEKLTQHRDAALDMLMNKDQIVNIVLCNKLDLSNKSYTEPAARIISDYLTKESKSQRSLASQVSIVNLADMIASRMEDEGLQVLKIISDSFKGSSLVDVDLSDNAMGSKGISACTSVLGGQYRSIKRLSLCNNGLSATSMEEIADILTSEEAAGTEDDCKSKRVSICVGLEKLHFFNNMSGNDGCKSFSRILSKCGPKLNDLRFSSTRAGKQGSLLISSALEKLGEKTLQSLERLDLADNSFGLDGAKSLCRALQHCKSLKYLNLSDCLLEAAGIELICKSLCDAEVMLEHLLVSSNELTESGSTHLTKLLKRCTSLKTFYAEENEMGSIGISNLVKEIPSTIEDLRLGWNECGKIGAQALVLASKRMVHLKQIHLDGNMFPEDEVNSLEEAFGDRLLEMEENEEEEDVDEMLDKKSDEKAKKDVKINDIKELPSCSSAKKASQIFDAADKEKYGILPSSMFDDLLEELGECFDSEEQRKRLAEVDPDKTGTIDRFLFVMWYVRLVGKSDIDEENADTYESNKFDHDSVDSDEEQERAEEAAKIIAAFSKVGGKDDCKSIPSTDFGKLMEAMGTAYCAAAHQKTIKKLEEEGYISIESFRKWYMSWLFCDDEDDDDDKSVDIKVSSDAETKSCTPKQECEGEYTQEGWGDIFTTEKGSWKCESCMLQNRASAPSCIACETIRPLSKSQEFAKGSTSSTLASSDKHGFSFGFQKTKTSQQQPSTTKSSFTFGIKDNASKTDSIPSSNITFGSFNLAQNKSNSSGFSFGIDNTTKATGTVPTSDTKNDTITNTLNKAKASSAYPPLPSKAPKPFGNTLKQPEITTPTRPTIKDNASAKGATSSYPPLSFTAPTPFSAKKATPSKPIEIRNVAEQKSQNASKQSNVSKGEQGNDASSIMNQRKVVKVNRPKVFGNEKISTGTTNENPTKDQKTKNPFSSINFASAAAPSTSNKSTFSFGTNSSQPAAMNSQTDNLFKKNTETVSSGFTFGLSKPGTLIGSASGDAFKFGSSNSGAFGSSIFGKTGSVSTSTTEEKTTIFEPTNANTGASSSPIKSVFGSLDGKPGPSFSSLAKSPEAKGQATFCSHPGNFLFFFTFCSFF